MTKEKVIEKFYFERWNKNYQDRIYINGRETGEDDLGYIDLKKNSVHGNEEEINKIISIFGGIDNLLEHMKEARQDLFKSVLGL